MSDLVAFLTARVDEDEAAADGLSFACRRPGPFRFVPGYGGPAADAFIAHFDPARVLREVEAKRAILADYARALNFEAGFNDGDEPRQVLEMTLRKLAAVYANHPGYDEAWRFS